MRRRRKRDVRGRPAIDRHAMHRSPDAHRKPRHARTGGHDRPRSLAARCVGYPPPAPPVAGLAPNRAIFLVSLPVPHSVLGTNLRTPSAIFSPRANCPFLPSCAGDIMLHRGTPVQSEKYWPGYRNFCLIWLRARASASNERVPFAENDAGRAVVVSLKKQRLLGSTQLSRPKEPAIPQQEQGVLKAH
jgi:hypothetical protein